MSASVENNLQELRTEWVKKSKNLKKCGQLLDTLKVELTKLNFLPTTNEKSSPHTELIMARSILEIAVEYSVTCKDIPAFERYMAQLKCYYYDYKYIGESENMYKLLGLHLLFLLSVNRVSEFHTELELLSPEIILNNKFIRPILALEQYIMEGRYNKIFQAKNWAPSEIYNYFMDILVDTVRDEIAACIEKAYDKIQIKEAAKRLNLKTTQEMKTFGQKRNWLLCNEGYYNFVDKTAKPKEDLPTLELAEQVIFYARELEMIV